MISLSNVPNQLQNGYLFTEEQCPDAFTFKHEIPFSEMKKHENQHICEPLNSLIHPNKFYV